MTFRDLIDAACAAGRSTTQRPRTRAWAAKKCGISVPCLYTLMTGTKTAQPWTIAKIAKGLGVSEEQVQKAVDRSRAEALAA
jgi:hypothetical protein